MWSPKMCKVIMISLQIQQGYEESWKNIVYPCKYLAAEFH